MHEDDSTGALMIIYEPINRSEKRASCPQNKWKLNFNVKWHVSSGLSRAYKHTHFTQLIMHRASYTTTAMA